MESDFSQYDSDIKIYAIDGEDGSINLSELHTAIQKSWRYKDRKNISYISHSSLSDTIAKIKMKDRKKPPKIGGYPCGLLEFGWGYYHYNESSLYVAPIEFDGLSNFYFKGYKDEEIENNLGIIDGLKINLRYISDDKFVKNNINEIKNIITKSWDKNKLKNVKSIERCKDNYVYKICMESMPDNVEDLKNRSIGDLDLNDPTVPTKKYIRPLLKQGWGIISIKRNELYLAKIQNYLSANKKYTFKTEFGNIQKFKPKPCELCGKREYIDDFVTGFKTINSENKKEPITKSLCKSCK